MRPLAKGQDRLKHGYVHPTTGLVFWGFNRNKPLGEYWMSREEFDRQVEIKKSYLEENKTVLNEKGKIRAREHRSRFPDRVKQNQAKWLAQNPDRARQISKKWRSANAEVINLNGSVRRARLRGAEAPKANKGVIREFYASAKRVQNCLGLPMSVDHILPIAKGGKHHQNNLQVMPLSLNCRKNDCLPVSPMWAS
jgi:5-methylcytosine-specific restriction endonuclease McrA